jgi:hypothetical protein
MKMNLYQSSHEYMFHAIANQHFYTAGSDNLHESEQAYGAVCKLIMWTAFQKNILKLVGDVLEG